ncbi:MAG TPA: hypothetical protein VKS81_08740 [Bacteroidota bacterium]|nr:hypothetical protein [Bacteroidota bacterium]
MRKQRKGAMVSALSKFGMQSGLALLVLFGLMISAGQAQVESTGSSKPVNFDRAIYGLGLSAGCADGLGIAYRSHFPGTVSFQLTAGIIKTSDVSFYDVGFEPQIDVYHGELNRFYACGAMSYFYNSPTSGSNTYSGPFRLGIGAGDEWGRAPFTFSFEVLLTYFSDGTVIPLPQIGAFYYFY